MVSGSNSKMGSNIVVVGLLIQVVMFCFFILTSVVFEVRMYRRPTAKTFAGELDWKKHLRTLYALSALILIRSIFRVFEYAAGSNGYLMEHEWPIYVFDALLMLSVMVIWAIWHPGILQKFLEEESAQMRMDHELRWQVLLRRIMALMCFYYIPVKIYIVYHTFAHVKSWARCSYSKIIRRVEHGLIAHKNDNIRCLEHRTINSIIFASHWNILPTRAFTVVCVKSGGYWSLEYISYSYAQLFHQQQW